MAKGSASIASLADVRLVRAALAEREEVRIVRQVDPRPGEPLDGVGPGDWTPDSLGLPPGCPVKPLGVAGDRMWFLDGIGQVRFLDPPYGKGHVLGLFGGRLEWLTWAWPRWGKEKLINGFANEEAAASLIKACMAKGPWESVDRMRGRGCWTDRAGNLVVHAGDRVYVGRQAHAPGELGEHVYPTRARIPGPIGLKDEVPFNPAPLLRSTLRTWNWSRPEIDPHLLLGWIGAAFLGAALPWRPMAFITGDKATGKSTLQALLKGIFGEWLLQAADTTAAGLYQHVGLDSVPIAVDELESESDVRKQRAVLKLARLASSGSVMLRGGDRHNPVEFKAWSAFLFSSINAPPLEPQDLSRMALLRLDRLPEGQKPPQIDMQAFGLVGRCILTRLMTEWPRFHETATAFAGELAAAGMDGRGQAQFGTLLACADMIEHEGWDEARLQFAHEGEGELVPWRRLLKPSQMHEYEDQVENWRACLSHLLSVRVEAWRNGTRQTVGQLLQGYLGLNDRGAEAERLEITEANRELAQAGLRIVFREREGRQRPWLAVHNQGVLVRGLFEGSKWAGELGASVWSQALRQGPRAQLWETGQVRINGVQLKATLLSLDGLYGPGGIMTEVAEEEEPDG